MSLFNRHDMLVGEEYAMSSTKSLSVMQPKNQVSLPASAQRREVTYFPPSVTGRGDGRGLVMLGSYFTDQSDAASNLLAPLEPHHIWPKTASSPTTLQPACRYHH